VTGESRTGQQVSLRPCRGTRVAQHPAMSNATPMVEPGPTRPLWVPELSEAEEPRAVPSPREVVAVPYLLAPSPWPRGQFLVDPEA
jgi:hypothetical protein